MAQQLGAVQLLVGMYEFEHFVHHNRLSLGTHLKPTNEGREAGIIGTVYGATVIADVALEAYFLGVPAAARLLGWDDERLGQLRTLEVQIQQKWRATKRRLPL